MNRSGKAIVVALAAALLCAARPADAASPAEIATARELYKQGADALDAGNATVAVEKLQAAWALLQTPVIGLALGRAQEKLGHLIEAREAAFAVNRMPKAPDETSLSAAARTDAQTLAESLARRVPHVMIHLNGANASDVAVKLDGVGIPQAALVAPRQVDPGTHKVMGDATDGRHAEATVTLSEGATKDVSLEFPAPTAPPPPTHEAHSEPVPAPELVAPPPHASISPLVWVGLAVGGVGLAMGGIAGAMTFGAKGSLTTNCTLPNGTGDGKAICPPSSDGDLSFAHAAATVSTVGFVAFGVGAAVLVTGLLLGHGREPRSHVTLAPMIGPVSGVAGTF